MYSRISVMIAIHVVCSTIAVQAQAPVTARAGSESEPFALKVGEHGGMVTEFTRPPAIQGMTAIEYRERLLAADAAFDAQQWGTAAAAYESVARAFPYNGEIWQRLAVARWNLGDFVGAGHAYAEAHRWGLRRYGFATAYEAAAAYARGGQAGEAARWLRTAIVTLNHPRSDALLEAEHFDGLRSSAPFQALLRERAAAPAATRIERWSADIDLFLREFRDLRRDLNAVEWASIEDAARVLQGRTDSLSDHEMLAGLQRIAAAAGKGHNTSPSVYSDLGVNGKALSVLPLDFYMFPEGLFVIGTVGPHEDLVGARVIAFGKVPTDEAVRRISTLIDRERGSDMAVMWLAPRYLSHPAFLSVSGIEVTGEAVRLTLELGSKDTVTRTIAGSAFRSRPRLYPPTAAPATTPLYLTRVSDPFWYRDLGSRVTYLQYNLVRRGPGRGTAGDSFAAELRQHLTASRTRDLIIDLRHNYGGDTYTYTELLKTLIEYDMKEGTRLYVITGRTTYSAAVNFITDLDRLTDPIFAGELSSAPNQGGDAVDILLPHNRLRMSATPVNWSMQSPHDTRTSIPVTVPVTLTAGDYFANRDPVMEAVAQLIERERGRSR